MESPPARRRLCRRCSRSRCAEKKKKKKKKNTPPPSSPESLPAALRLGDSHVHTWKHSPDFLFAPGGANVPAEDASAEMLPGPPTGQPGLALHRHHPGITHYKWDNSYLASVLKRYPRRSAEFAAGTLRILQGPTSSRAGAKSMASTASAFHPSRQRIRRLDQRGSFMPAAQRKAVARSSKFP